jgi:hypothetical protein
MKTIGMIGINPWQPWMKHLNLEPETFPLSRLIL